MPRRSAPRNTANNWRASSASSTTSWWAFSTALTCGFGIPPRITSCLPGFLGTTWPHGRKTRPPFSSRLAWRNNRRPFCWEWWPGWWSKRGLTCCYRSVSAPSPTPIARWWCWAPVIATSNPAYGKQPAGFRGVLRCTWSTATNWPGWCMEAVTPS